jgi:DNA-binding LacI/PurR family transcriptional regulator
VEGRRASIRDVAREAGVSVTTVSHALNDKGRLHPETRARVREVAQRLGYRPNPAARSLVSGRTGLIAALVSLPSGVHPNIGEFGFFADLIGGATGVAVAHDVALVVAPTATEQRGAEPFVWDRIPLDAVVMVGPMRGDPTLSALRDRGIPYVTIGRDPDGEPAGRDGVIEADDAGGTRAVLDHLHQAGAAKPGFIALPPLFAFTVDTAAAYEAWCTERGLEANIRIVEIGDLLADRRATVKEAVEDLLAQRTDAIHCPVEQLGVEALSALDELGASVPDDVLLSTTNDAGRADIASVPITTVETDHADVGRIAVEALLDVVAGERRPPFRIRVPTRVVPRASTARPPGRAASPLG